MDARDGAFFLFKYSLRTFFIVKIYDKMKVGSQLFL